MSRRHAVAAFIALPLTTLPSAWAYHRATADPVYDEARQPLLVSLGDVTHARGVRLALADRAGPLPGDELPLVTVTRTALLVGNTPLTEVPPGEQVAMPWGFRGLDQHKGDDLLLRPLLSTLEAARARARASQPEAILPDGVRLAFDPETPYRDAAEVVYTAAQAGLGRYYLLSESPSGRGALSITVPSYAARGRRVNPCTTGHVYALVAPDRLELRSSWPCTEPGDGRGVGGQVFPSGTVTAVSGRLPRREVIEAARRLYPHHPDFDVPVIELTALPQTPWQPVLDAIAALQAAGPSGEIDPFRPGGEGPPADPQLSLAAPQPSVEAWDAKRVARETRLAALERLTLRRLSTSEIEKALSGPKLPHGIS